MSVAEIQSELTKLSPQELQDVWESLEEIMDQKAGNEARQRGDFVSLQEYQRMSETESD